MTLGFLKDLLYPLPIGLIGIFFAWFLLISGLRRTGISLNVFSLLWLWAWSTPVFTDAVRYSLERHYEQAVVEDLPVHEAVVVLGGAFISPASDFPYPNLRDPADRYWHAARLFHAGRADRIILTGGGILGVQARLSEARTGAIFLADLGVPEEAIFLEERSRTTRKNAEFVVDILDDLDIDEFHLVTSALHMRRAEGAFRIYGVSPNPVATDFEIIGYPDLRLSRWKPRASAIADGSRAWHEYAGLWVYRLRGWLD